MSHKNSPSKNNKMNILSIIKSCFTSPIHLEPYIRHICACVFLPSRLNPKRWGIFCFSSTNTILLLPFTSDTSILSYLASAQYNFLGVAAMSMARPLGQPREELMSTCRLLPSKLATSILATFPQSLQYIKLKDRNQQIKHIFTSLLADFKHVETFFIHFLLLHCTKR